MLIPFVIDIRTHAMKELRRWLPPVLVRRRSGGAVYLP